LPDIWLPYGKTEVCVRIPTENLRDVIKAAEVKHAEDPRSEIENSIRNPLKAENLAEIAKQGGNAALALNISDPSIASTIVSLILEELTHAGLKPADLTIIFAHDPFSQRMNEMKRQLKDEMSQLGVKAIFHNYLSDCVQIGELPNGTKIYVNKAFAESEIKIVASTVEPNPYTFYSGCGYTVLLGLSNMDTISQILSPILNFDEPINAFKNINIHKAMTETLHLADVKFTINLVCSPSGRIIKSFAGDVDNSYDEAAKLADSIYKVQVERRAPIVFASPGGSPFDNNLFESYKCVENSLRIVRRNGVFVLVAECFGGFGNRKFQEALLKFKENLDFLRRILRRNFSIGGFMAYRFLRATKKADICMVSAMPNYYISEALGLKAFRTANEALNYALERAGKRAGVSAILHGNLTMPIIGGT